MTPVELEPDEARYLSILAAADIRRTALLKLAARPWHQAAWDKLQDACQWRDPQ